MGQLKMLAAVYSNGSLFLAEFAVSVGAWGPYLQDPRRIHGML